MSHPYEAFKADPLWPIVSEAFRDLAENGDVHEMTAREYIVGLYREEDSGSWVTVRRFMTAPL